jgi:hypothetical protein
MPEEQRSGRVLGTHRHKRRGHAQRKAPKNSPNALRLLTPTSALILLSRISMTRLPILGMRPMSRSFPWYLLSVCCVAVGCAAEAPPPVSEGSGGGSPGSGGDRQEDGTGGGLPPLDPDPDPPCPTHCDSDLKSVVDCEGRLVAECADGDACLDGACVEDACAAALASQTSVGCDYWAIKPDQSIDSARVACFAVVVANTWDTALTLEVTFQGESLSERPFVHLPRGQGLELSYEAYDPATGVPPGDVAILFLADSAEPGGPYPGCPVAPYFKEEVGVWDTGRGEAFHIETTAPAAVYSVVPYGGGAGATTSASLLLPTGLWEREYIAVNPFAKSELVAQGLPSLNILASEDGTTVDILPKVPIVGGPGVDPAPAGEPVTYVLDRGEFLQISQVEELTGSPIASDKPIAVWGGSSCMNIPVATPTGDAAHQQLPPISAMGHEYVAVRHRNRATAGNVEEESPWRIVAAVDGTELEWEPAAPPDAPAALDQGVVYEFWSTGPFIVKSQDEEHPFYVGQYMTSGTHVAEGAQEGDPEWINVVTPQQYLKSYVFFTDPTYPETSLVVVREPGIDGAFFDVTLDCEGVLSGWQPLGRYEYTRTRLTQGQFENVGTCSNGVQRMQSDGRFGVTVWGWGTSGTEPRSALGSYAYPAGVGLRAVSEAVLPPIVVR